MPRSKQSSGSKHRRLSKEIARGREEITRTILTEARKIIPQYGIELVDVRIKRLDYVESVREKVYERMVSERKRIAAQFRSEGEPRKRAGPMNADPLTLSIPGETGCYRGKSNK